jgi:hypothetical protein
MKTKKTKEQREALTKSLAGLDEFFRRNGYVRAPNQHLKEKLGAKYHKGWEVRLVLNNQKELAQVQELLADAGFKAGNSFIKHGLWVQPVYGKQAAEYFE